jgi:hypothetical protein
LRDITGFTLLHVDEFPKDASNGIARRALGASFKSPVEFPRSR